MQPIMSHIPWSLLSPLHTFQTPQPPRSDLLHHPWSSLKSVFHCSTPCGKNLVNTRGQYLCQQKCFLNPVLKCPCYPTKNGLSQLRIRKCVLFQDDIFWCKALMYWNAEDPYFYITIHWQKSSFELKSSQISSIWPLIWNQHRPCRFPLSTKTIGSTNFWKWPLTRSSIIPRIFHPPLPSYLSWITRPKEFFNRMTQILGPRHLSKEQLALKNALDGFSRSQIQVFAYESYSNLWIQGEDVGSALFFHHLFEMKPPHF